MGYGLLTGPEYKRFCHGESGPNANIEQGISNNEYRSEYRNAKCRMPNAKMPNPNA